MFLGHRTVQKCRKLVWPQLEAGGPWLDKKSIVPHKTPLHAKFHVISSIGGNFTALFAGVRSLCSPPLLFCFVGGTGVRESETDDDNIDNDDNVVVVDNIVHNEGEDGLD